MSFSDKLKQLRKEKGVTQVELADAIGVERSSVGKYEGSKQVMPSDDVKVRIAKYFGVSVDYLLDVKPEDRAIREEALRRLAADEPYHPAVTPSEYALVLKYRSLNTDGRDRLAKYAAFLLQDPALQLDPPAQTADA